MTKLFQPLKVGAMYLQHCVVMAPLTRFRADDNHVQLPMAVEYYCQRASVPGTLLIAEASLISATHGGFPNALGVWDYAQIAGWKKVVDAVHARGCYIVCQLFAPGRAADATTLQKEGGYDVLSSSPIPLTDVFPVPKAMSEDQIQGAITDYANAAKNAIRAGFDGVEVHGANGYLADQFLQDTCNRRTDRWGGSIQNPARFGIEVATAIVNAIGADELGYGISPWSSFQRMRMADPVPQFSYLIEALKDLKLGYLHVIESRVNNNVDVEKVEGIEFALDIWGHTSPVLVAGGFDANSAKSAVDSEYRNNDVAVVFGRHFLANADLPFRIQHGLDLNMYHRPSFFTPMTRTGYTDYPFSADYLARNNV
jgi:NADH:flavin oxidoreductases, Old Yellow Enzyme family